uniref:Odorant binding protein 1 n=1 Tax=Trissolcus japonicus TaxID=1388796 RepID=A0A7G6J4J7_9HYME|nr:odorant binding protein 1 [Trissolcus japonicus]
MKFFIAVFALCIVGALGALTDEQKAKLKEHKEHCFTETGVDPAVVENVKKGQFVQDPKLACFTACVMKRIGVMNANGSINEEVARAKLPATVSVEKAAEILGSCKSLKGANDCETAVMVFKCYMQHGKVNILAF